MRNSSVPACDYVPTADHRVVLHGVSWAGFEALLRLRGDVAGPRVAYLCGELELMSPSKHHESIKSFIGRLVECYALEAGIDLSPYGGWTLKKQVQEVGVEPDECYIIGSDQNKARPDLVIEVVWTRGGLDKLEIYQRLGIPEFWQWKGGAIEIFALRKGAYVRASRSTVLPGLDLELLVSFLERPTALQAVRAFREAIASRQRSRPRRR